MNGKSIYWLLQHDEDLQEDDDWLSLQERLILRRMKFPKRRGEWRLGRWTAKQILFEYCKKYRKKYFNLSEIEILPTESGAPQLFIQKKSDPITISISHRGGAGFCVINPNNKEIGCDIEIIEKRSEVFVLDYFTKEEQLKVMQSPEKDQALLANLIWSAKESVLKALHRGLKSDTRSVLINLNKLAVKKGWNEIRARSLEFNKDFYGWWWNKERYILTIFSSESTGEPIDIRN